ncbi:MAG: universal stress protein, partial [Bacteroidetes bacterium]|nr:universal stress protein [Bacteroidota bacterium]
VLSLQLGFAVVPLIHFVSNKKRMGSFAIGPWTKALAWACALLILGLNAKLIIDQIFQWIGQYPNAALWIYILVIPVTFAVALLLMYVFLRPLLFKHRDQPAQVPHGLATMITDFTPIAYKNIGVTIDFSKNDRDCIRHAIMQGGKHAHYTLIHVVETAAAQYYGTEVLDHETQSDADNLDKYVQSMLEKDYKAKGVIGFGSPAKSITQIVKDEQIDFLVMGSHGHKAFKDLIFGTTVNSVRHKVNIPVLVVKPQ